MEIDPHSVSCTLRSSMKFTYVASVTQKCSFLAVLPACNVPPQCTDSRHARWSIQVQVADRPANHIEKMHRYACMHVEEGRSGASTSNWRLGPYKAGTRGRPWPDDHEGDLRPSHELSRNHSSTRMSVNAYHYTVVILVFKPTQVA